MKTVQPAAAGHQADMGCGSSDPAGPPSQIKIVILIIFSLRYVAYL
jgi:hypothetical protein